MGPEDAIRETAEEEIADTEEAPIEPAAGTEAVPDTKAKKRAVLERAKAFVGRVISDRYRVEEVLAAGGMGCVYRGQHVHMRKRVAIKVLLPDTEGLPDLVLRFEREAIAGAHINHPNVAAATDFGKLEDGSYFLILEYIRGITLHDLIKQGPVAPVRAVRIARQLAAALDACHSMGVIHRDMKPRNVMLEEGRNDSVKLIDFGLAKVPMDRISTIGIHEVHKSGREVTGMGIVFGTIAYMAPEAAFGMGAVDERSDLYAFGVMLYEMLAGAHPFDGRDPAETFKMHRTVKPPPIRVRSPGVDVAPRLEAVVMRLLEKGPSDRFADARAVIAALDAAMPSAALDLGIPVVASSSSLPVRIAGAVAPATVTPADLAEQAAAMGFFGAGSGASGSIVGQQSFPDGSLPPHVSMPTASSPPEAYVPRLGSRPAPASSGSSTLGAPRWAIAAAIGLAAVAALGTVLVLSRIERGSADGRGPAPAGVATSSEREIASLGAEVHKAAGPGTKPAEPPGAEEKNAAELRAQLRTAADSKDWGKGASALTALAKIEPAAFTERDIAASTVAIAAGLELAGDERSNVVFETLTNRLGPVGLEILFDIVTTRGGSKAAARAGEIFRRPEVLERTSPALRIAVELRDAPCKDKLSLLARAKAEGDLRSVAFLDILRAETCNPHVGQCCYRRNILIDEAIHLIRARLREGRTAPADARAPADP